MTTQASWLSRLHTILGADQIDAAPDRLAAFAVDGRLPTVAVYPQTFDQVQALLRLAQGEKLAVLPRGNGTKVTFGNPPRRADIVLSTSRLQRITEYDPANLTLTGEAGVTFSQVACLTAEHRQTLPLQHPFSGGTLGGIIATNAYNPKRLAYGGVRDLLLGMRVALPSGEIAHFGGRVVKNVAGYDLCKLFLGSLGALGVVLEATFKLYALAERDETLLATFPSLQQGAEAAAHLLGTQLLPSQVLLLNPTAAGAMVAQFLAEMPAGSSALLVNFEGMDEAVERQLAEMSQVCRERGAHAVQVLSGDAQLRLWQRIDLATHASGPKMLPPPLQPSPPEGIGTRIRPPLPPGEGRGEGSLAAIEQLGSALTLALSQKGEGTKTPPRPPSPLNLAPMPLEGEGADEGEPALVLRLGTLPSQVHTVMEAVAQLLTPLAPQALILGDGGVGLVKVCIRRPARQYDQVNEHLATAVEEMRRLVAREGGYVVVEAAPPDLKAKLDVWGPPPSAFGLLKALKAKFDPQAVLNPGRFVGGL